MIQIVFTAILWWILWIVVAAAAGCLVAAFAMMFTDKGEKKPSREDSGFGGPWE